MDYFSRKKSSSFGKYYYQNKITGKKQWGVKEGLPKGWILLDDEKPVYKYIGYPEEPTELKEILTMTYQELVDQKYDEEAQEEACRRQNLFDKVARRLKLSTDSICNESLQYLADKANVPIEKIILYIEQTERKQLAEKAEKTAFSRIKRDDSSFATVRSIRELFGVNMREVEASKAMSQIHEELICPMTNEVFKDPVTCSSGHTFERHAILNWLLTNEICPVSDILIDNYIVPNYALRKVLENFVEKYEHQKGGIWKSIVRLCLDYKYFTGRLSAPEYVFVPESKSEMKKTGRTSEEIRKFMNDNNYMESYAEDIPDLIAGSSYAQAVKEAKRRYKYVSIQESEYEMKKTGRTSEEIRTFLIVNEYMDLEILEYIPDLMEGSSYADVIKEIKSKLDEITSE